MVKTFSHMGINCKDPVGMEKFYTHYFGFKRARVYKPGSDQIVMIKSGGIYLELFKAGADSPLAPPKKDGYTFPGFRHICFAVEDLDSVLSELGETVKITHGPRDMSKLIDGMKIVWVADPEGNIIELIQGYADDPNPPPLTN